MSKNALIITGSPRKGGNSEMLAGAFARGAAAKGHSVIMFNAAAKSIGGCQACGTCWSKGRACSRIDGFTELEPLLEQADAVIFSSPLYWFSFSSQIKAAIDKMNAYDSENKLCSIKGKESALLVCGAGDNIDIFDGITHSFNLIVRYLNWRNIGVLVVPGLQEKGAVLKGNALMDAEQFGARL